ncbi:MAG: prolyl oligopeptidase family serine peptidase [Firmicutes bacterium]|nr:prolyl oligopeptidase family serine peptidase [Bacillota bacterium]
MAIIEVNLKLNGAPALMMFREKIERAASKGTILFYHGLYSRKETHRKELESLAGRGFLAIAIDNLGHGGRQLVNLRDSLSGPDFEYKFLNLVKETALEIPGIIDELDKMGFADVEKLGISGISMGGYITYAGVLADPRFKAAAPILGSPVWRGFNGDSPHSNPHLFYPVALLSQNAGKDTSVPAYNARNFHNELKPYYRRTPQKLEYVEFPNSGHFMNALDWHILWGNVIDWFDDYIR